MNSLQPPPCPKPITILSEDDYVLETMAMAVVGCEDQGQRRQSLKSLVRYLGGTTKDRLPQFVAVQVGDSSRLMTMRLSQYEEIKDRVSHGQKRIQAVKLMREITGLGLKDAVQAVKDSANGFPPWDSQEEE
jgi:hypothetical protein